MRRNKELLLLCLALSTIHTHHFLFLNLFDPQQPTDLGTVPIIWTHPSPLTCRVVAAFWILM